MKTAPKRIGNCSPPTGIHRKISWEWPWNRPETALKLPLECERNCPFIEPKLLENPSETPPLEFGKTAPKLIGNCSKIPLNPSHWNTTRACWQLLGTRRGTASGTRPTFHPPGNSNESAVESENAPNCSTLAGRRMASYIQSFTRPWHFLTLFLFYQLQLLNTCF